MQRWVLEPLVEVPCAARRIHHVIPTLDGFTYVGKLLVESERPNATYKVYLRWTKVTSIIPHGLMANNSTKSPSPLPHLPAPSQFMAWAITYPFTPDLSNQSDLVKKPAGLRLEHSTLLLNIQVIAAPQTRRKFSEQFESMPAKGKSDWSPRYVKALGVFSQVR